jgi:replicative DNA helicase
MVGVINAGEYGRVIHDAWLRRQLIDVGETLVTAFGAEPELDAGQMEAASRRCSSCPRKGGGGGFVRSNRAGDSVRHAGRLLQPGRRLGPVHGLRDFDAKTGGLHRSDLLILAGRPAMGKTALATKIAFGAARAVLRKAKEADPNAVPRGGVAIFSLEMSCDQLATRLLSEEARISGDRIRRGDIVQRDFDRFVEVSRELQQLPLYIDDTPAISISALRTRCRRLQRTRGLDLVVVDYLQLMRPAAGTKPESRVQEISQITQG